MATASHRTGHRHGDNTPDAIDLYLGDDEGTHTTRIGCYRVTRDGRVWENTDETGIEDRWVTIE